MHIRKYLFLYATKQNQKNNKKNKIYSFFCKNKCFLSPYHILLMKALTPDH